MKSERVRFPGAQGVPLAARLELPQGAPRAFALFAHCFTCSKDYKAVVHISRRLAASGIAVCRFDFTGLGESDGDFAQTDLTSNVDDLLAAASYLRSHYRAPELLIGHSLGGAAILAAAGRIPETRAVVTLAAPSDTEHLSRQLTRLAPQIEHDGEAQVSIGGRSLRLRRQLLEDLESHRIAGYLETLDRPLLILHSPDDEQLDIEHAERLFAQASHPKSFIAIDGADHLLSRRAADWQLVASLIEDWAGRYLSEEDTVSEPEDPRDRAVLVRGGSRGYSTSIKTGRHSLRADEPRSVGGADSGPNPYSLLLAALGACKVITMRMYADHKGWPLRGSQVELIQSRIHARDCEDCESTEGLVDRIDVHVELEGPLSAEQSRRILEISERCPVQRTLTGEVSIRSTSV